MTKAELTARIEAAEWHLKVGINGCGFLAPYEFLEVTTKLTEAEDEVKRLRGALELARSYMIHGTNWQGPMIIPAGKSWAEDSEVVRKALASSEREGRCRK